MECRLPLGASVLSKTTSPGSAESLTLQCSQSLCYLNSCFWAALWTLPVTNLIANTRTSAPNRHSLTLPSTGHDSGCEMGDPKKAQHLGTKLSVHPQPMRLVTIYDTHLAFILFSITLWCPKKGAPFPQVLSIPFGPNV